MINKLLTDQIITNCHPAVKFQSSQQVHKETKNKAQVDELQECNKHGPRVPHTTIMNTSI